MFISSAFDSGNIEVLDASDPSNLLLAIRPDAGGEHMQWFHFRVAGARDRALTMRLTNAHKASYPHAWEGYRAVTSVDRVRWTRVPTAYEESQLVLRHSPVGDVQYYAYFAPYSLERHQDLLGRCADLRPLQHAFVMHATTPTGCLRVTIRRSGVGPGIVSP